MTVPEPSPAPSAPHSPSAAPYPPAPAAAGNPLGTVAAILGFATIVVGLTGTVVQQLLIRSGSGMGSITAISVTSAVFGLVNAAIALVAVILALIAISQKGRPRLMAGIGLGLAIAVLSGMLSWALIYLLPPF